MGEAEALYNELTALGAESFEWDHDTSTDLQTYTVELSDGNTESVSGYCVTTTEALAKLIEQITKRRR